jgi:hypothetical protein
LARIEATLILLALFVVPPAANDVEMAKLRVVLDKQKSGVGHACGI